jgi:hypothetical protein
MGEYVIVDPDDPDVILGQVTVDEAGTAVVHDLVGTPGVIQFETLDQVRAVLSAWQPHLEIREA